MSENTRIAQTILSQVPYITLATATNDGIPWNAPVYAAFDEAYTFLRDAEWREAQQISHKLNKGFFNRLVRILVQVCSRNMHILISDSKRSPPATNCGPGLDTTRRNLGSFVAAQRINLRMLMEQAEVLLGEALFVLSYWARCQVSDVAHLLVEYTHVGPKVGWLPVGYKGSTFRDLGLPKLARRPLYLEPGDR